MRTIYWAAAFLLGSIPFGLLVAKIFNVDNLRKAGSGNIGATNVSRVIGFWPAGLITFSLDLLKGVLPPLLMLWVGGGDKFEQWLVGFMAVLGHCFSPWLGFRGGKGISTGLGIMLVLAPVSALVGAFVFSLVFFQYRIASLASIAGLMSASILHLICHPVEKPLWVLAALNLLILIRHEGNIDAFFQNKERSFR
jgi:acyl phosphate:glycerol-3-phosphate acyltransferase